MEEKEWKGNGKKGKGGNSGMKKRKKTGAHTPS